MSIGNSQQFVVGNWKMNGRTSDVRKLKGALEGQRSIYRGVVCPPFTLLRDMKEAISEDVALGAQDCSSVEEGAHTGDIAATQLQEIGVQYVILGHSERRKDHNESSEIIALKIQKALEALLTPIVCVGESEAVYENGGTLTFLQEQVRAFLPGLAEAKTRGLPFLIAYEPLWAIGTGRQPRLDEIAAIHRALFEMTGLEALYGGSVKQENYKGILAQECVGGVLVGGESLKPDRFSAMLRGE